MTLIEMVSAMISYVTLPISFWGYTLDIAMYLLNLVPSQSFSKKPIGLWLGQKPSMRYIHVWGCATHVLKG